MPLTLGLSGSQSQLINPITDFTNESPTDIIYESPNASVVNANPNTISPNDTSTATATTPIGTGSTGGDGTLLMIAVIGVAALLFLKHKKST